jgi:molecular chaperone Hsp33
LSELHKFIFDGEPVRGMLVRLTDGWQDVLGRRAKADEPFAQPVRGLLGEMAAAAVLMQANIKFNGALNLQIYGDGPVKLAVAEVQPTLEFRVTAKVVGAVGEGAGLAALVNVRGHGRCAITLDPNERLPGQQPYQGVVSLNGELHQPLDELSRVIEHYMLQSEQLDTKLVLAADDTVAAGLLIQRLPTAGAGNLRGSAGARDEDRIGVDESYNRIAHLAASLTRQELLTLDADTVLRRLFWEERLVRFDLRSGRAGPRFACSCSRERVGNMLKGLGRVEIDSILAEQGRVEIACEFCGAKYRYDPVDVGELFTPARDQPPGSRTLN